MSDDRKPLRIALIRQRYRDDGGAERFVARALDALREQGTELTIIARKWQTRADIRAVRCNPFYLGRTWRDAGFARCVCAHLGKEHYDIVQSHERIACCDVYRAGDGVHREWLRQRARTLPPAARLAQALNPYHRYTLAAERRLFEAPRLKAVICNSRMVREEILRYFRIDEKKLHVIYSGVDIDAFHPRLKQQRQAVRRQLDIPDAAPVFLFVGSGFLRKGLAAAIAGLEHTPQNAQLVIVGQDKHADRFEGLARKRGLAARCHFLGAQADVKPYYGAADVLVLPTLYDPFPNVILEAMAAGLPVITSEKCGGAEFIREGENGYSCDALDTRRLGRHMNSIIAKADKLRAMGAAARATVEPYDLQAMSRRLLALYEGLRQDGPTTDSES